ncbi:MAG: ferrous iron transport protein B [Desulfovibrio sp.]|jgi:ferrous iron transport protein B|nr:ferrous iron transport protein B [Desulfovibrio sp.]
MLTANNFIAIAGNPNSGKTTAFNWYTGARQHVGNYPGITVEKKEGTAHLGKTAVALVDLPGAYSLTAYSLEEIVARKVLAEERPGAVLDVVNAGVLERNLYLAVQLMELGVPVVLALNMMDEAKAKGLNINARRLEELLGLPVVPAVARRGEGLKEALAAAVTLAEERRNSEWIPLEISYGSDIDEALARMIPLVRQADVLAGKYPARWVAIKYLERDADILAQGQAFSPETHKRLTAVTDEVTKHLRSTLNSFPEAVIADYRYGYIASVLRQGVLTEEKSIGDRIAWSDKLDQVLTNRLFGPLILMGLLYAMYFVTFEIGAYPSDWLAAGFEWLHGAAGRIMDDGMLKSLITSGVIDGAGGVLSFVPLIVIMFLFISVLEDSGYMARVAYMMDRIFRVFGLHGASIMPFIVSGGIAGGCAVPGIMATRTLRSPRERLATILTAPFMACGAKLPVFLLFAGIFFEERQALVMFCITLTGWAAALLVARLLRSTVVRGAATPFVMELPPYRLPTLSGVLIHTWERTWQYIKKAGTIILAISVLIWAGMSFPELPVDVKEKFAAEKAALSSGRPADSAQKTAKEEDSPPKTRLEAAIAAIDNELAGEALRNSYAGKIGIALEPLTGLAGFDWRTNIALVAGIAAKEVVVATLGTAYSLGAVDAEDDTSLAERIRADKQWTTANAAALLLFTLLYSPCFVTLAIIRQESGKWRWLFFSLFFNLSLAFAVAAAVNQIILRT